MDAARQLVELRAPLPELGLDEVEQFRLIRCERRARVRGAHRCGDLGEMARRALVQPACKPPALGVAGRDHPPARCEQLHDLRARGRLEAIVGQHQPGGVAHGADELRFVQ